MIAIIGGRVHTCGSRGTIDRATILIDGTKIVDVLERADVPSDCQIVNAEGLEIVPGFVDAHSHLGIPTEGLGVPDANEGSDPITPHLRAIDAFDPFEPYIERVLQSGVTTVGLLPGSSVSFGSLIEEIGVITGMGSVIKTFVREGRVTVLREKAGMKFAVGAHPKRFFAEKKAPPATRMNIIGLIRENLEAARLYSLKKTSPTSEDFNLKKELLLELLHREFPARVHVHTVRDIISIIGLQTEFGFDLVLDHVTEGYMIADELARRNVPCVVGPLTVTRRGSDLKNISLKNPAVLAKAGVKVALTTDHPTFPAGYLPFHAGIAVREGLDYEMALKAITIVPAEILGVADRVGSIGKGKDADMVLFHGDPLEIISEIRGVMVDGQFVAGSLSQGNS